MDSYKRKFLSVITEEQEVNMSPDSDAWAMNNPDIMDDETVAKSFSTAPLPVNAGQSHVKMFKNWAMSIDRFMGQLEAMYEIASKNVAKVGLGEIDSTVGKEIEQANKLLGSVRGQLRLLGAKVDKKIKQDKAKGR
jgi:hypothetical protein